MQGLKELVAILVLTAPVWWLAWRALPGWLPEGALPRRGKVWLLLTVSALLAPSIWLYLAVAIPTLVWAARREPNPAALAVLLLFAVPNAAVYLPAPLVNQLFQINHQRTLTLCVLLPAWLALRRQGERPGADRMDVFLGALVLLMVALAAPLYSFTGSLRGLFLLAVDLLLLFMVYRRLHATPQAVRDSMAMWVLGGALVAAVASFESLRGWLLYTGVNSRWGDENAFAFLLRAGALRGQAATGHSLTAGIWIASAWACFLAVQRGIGARWQRWALGAVLLVGLWCTYARAAWLAGVLATVVYLLLDPQGFGRAMRGLLLLCGAAALLLVSPLGDRVMELLPFIGTVESGNVEYRQQLFEVSMQLILANPLFGNPLAMEGLESLRQGQGIIDLVNGYIRIALFNGLVGLGLFVALLLTAALRGLRAWLALRRSDAELARAMAALLAAFAANAFFIATAGIDPMTYMLAGMLGGAAVLRQRLAQPQRPAPQRPAPPMPARGLRPAREAM